MDPDGSAAPEPTGRIIPVFVTADVPVEVLDRLLREDARRRTRDSLRLHVVRSADPGYLASVSERTRPPVEEPLESPFLGWTPRQLNGWFLDNVQPLAAGRDRFSWWAYCCFLVVDECSAATGSVYVAAADESRRGPDAPPTGPLEPRSPRSRWTYVEDETGPELLRCSFSVARHAATPVEVQGFGLLEHMDEGQVAVVQTAMQVPPEY